MTRTFGFCAVGLLIAALSLPAMAQAAGDGVAGGGSAAIDPNAATAKKGDSQPNPAQQQRMLENIQKILGSTDDEFAVLSPKIIRILTLRREANLPGSGAGRRVGGSGPARTQNPDGSPLPPVLLARAELQNVMQDPNATPELIHAKLEAFRSALTQAKADIAAAEKDLIAVLTPRQETLLVLNEVLE